MLTQDKQELWFEFFEVFCLFCLAFSFLKVWITPTIHKQRKTYLHKKIYGLDQLSSLIKK